VRAEGLRLGWNGKRGRESGEQEMMGSGTVVHFFSLVGKPSSV
jgi:hypothetical protein